MPELTIQWRRFVEAKKEQGKDPVNYRSASCVSFFCSPLLGLGKLTLAWFHYCFRKSLVVSLLHLPCSTSDVERHPALVWRRDVQSFEALHTGWLRGACRSVVAVTERQHAVPVIASFPPGKIQIFPNVFKLCYGSYKVINIPFTDIYQTTVFPNTKKLHSKIRLVKYSEWQGTLRIYRPVKVLPVPSTKQMKLSGN